MPFDFMGLLLYIDSDIDGVGDSGVEENAKVEFMRRKMRFEFHEFLRQVPYITL